MRALRLIAAAAVLAALASLAPPVVSSVAPPLAEPLAAAGIGPAACAAAGPHHAALVVQHADGATVTRCVAFAASSITGEQLLNASGIAWSGQSFSGFGQAVCAVDREPATYASCPGADRYWAVFMSRAGGAWQLTAVGVSSVSLHDGDAVGLHFVPTSGQPSAPRSPRGVCAAAATPAPKSAAAATAAVAATGAVAATPTAPTSGTGPSGSPAATGGATSEATATPPAGRIRGPGYGQTFGSGTFATRFTRSRRWPPGRRVCGRRPARPGGPATGGSQASAAVSEGRTARLGPRAWLVWSIAAVTVALVTDNPVYRGLVALVAFNVLLAWMPPGRRLRPLAFAVAFAVGFAVAINVLAGHTGSDVIFRLPDWIPLAGGPITLESAAFGVAVGLGLVAALLAVAPLSIVLEAHEVVDAMPHSLERSGIAVASSLNLMSGFGRTFAEVRDAQRMRGWQPRGLRSWNEVLVPTLLTAIEDSVRLAEAMEARAFGSGRRTGYAGSSTSAWGFVVALSAVGAVALFVGARLAGVETDWYPYPVLSMPPVNPILAVGCLALALPAIRSRAASPDAVASGGAA